MKMARASCLSPTICLSAAPLYPDEVLGSIAGAALWSRRRRVELDRISYAHVRLAGRAEVVVYTKTGKPTPLV
jgi:hypothetical protein